MKKITLLLFLLGLAVSASAFPFQTTSDPSSSSTHWYQLKADGKYVTAISGFADISVSSTASTADTYLWCFVTLSSNKVAVYSRSRKAYLSSIGYFTTSTTDSELIYAEDSNGGVFYLYFMTRGQKMYLNYDEETDFIGQAWTDTRYSVTEVDVPKVTAKPVIKYDFTDDACIIEAIGDGTVTLYVDDQLVENPYSIALTGEDQSVLADAFAQEEGKERSWTSVVINIPAKSAERPGEDLGVVQLWTYGRGPINNDLEIYGDEGIQMVVDGDRTTRWRIVNSTGSWQSVMIVVRSDQPFFPTSYIMTTASDTHDYPNRNPKSWVISGRTVDSGPWIRLSEITDGAAAGLGTANTTDYEFPITGNSKPYKYFRIDINEICGTEGNKRVFQLAEFQIKGKAVVAAPSGDLNSDGNVNTGDVSELYKAVLNGATDSKYDLNGDGNVNTGDVSFLYSIILGN